MSVISVGTLVLLSVIQISRYYFMDTGTIWIFRYGFPITLLWLGVTWGLVFCRCALKWNIWDCLAALMLMALIGNYITKLIIGDYGWNDLWSVHNFVCNSLGEFVGAVVFMIMGRIKKWKK